MDVEFFSMNKGDHTGDYYTCIFKAILEGKELPSDFNLFSFKKICLTFTILDNIGERVALTNRDFDIVLCNQAFIDYFHKYTSKVIGEKCYFVEYGKDKPCFEEGKECSARQVFQTGKNYTRIELDEDKEGNQIIIEVKSYPIKDNQGNTLMVLFAERDITEAKRQESNLQDKVRELQEFYDMAIGRELRMIELKEEVDNLKSQLEDYKKL